MELLLGPERKALEPVGEKWSHKAGVPPGWWRLRVMHPVLLHAMPRAGQ